MAYVRLAPVREAFLSLSPTGISAASTVNGASGQTGQQGQARLGPPAPSVLPRSASNLSSTSAGVTVG